MISKAQVRNVAESEVVESKHGSFIKTLCIAGILIGLVVGFLGFAEWRHYQAKISETESKIESLIGIQHLDEAVALTKKVGLASELADMRETFATSTKHCSSSHER